MEKTIQYKNNTAFYNVTGKGKPVMLLHGFIEEGSMWNDTVKLLAQNYKVIVPDLPGFGKSPLGEDTELSMEWYAACIKAIADAEKLKKFTLLGHSMGGYVTLNFVEKWGAMLNGFGLVNSHCFEDTPEKKENRKKGIEFIKKHGTKPFVTELYYNIFNDGFKKKPAGKKLIELLIAKAIKYTPEAVMQANAAMMNRKDKSEVLKNAKVPVLFICGKEDPSVSFDLSLKQAPYPPVAHIHIYSPCKHMSMFEKKKEVLNNIAEFVRICS